MRLTLAQIGDAEFKKRLDVDRYLPGATDQAIEFNADADQGTFTVSFSGRKLMDWNKYRQLASPRFRFGDSTMGWRLESKGREGVNASIPFMLGIPVHIVLREEVILPAQGKGYALEGKNFDRTVAGTRITRSLALDNGRAVVTSSLVRLQPELPAAEAQVSIAALAEIAADAAYVTAVADLEIQPWLLSREPETAEEFISRGYDRMDNQRVRYAGTDFDKAIEFVKDGLADLDQAIKLAPDSSVAHSLRAMALISLGRLDEAETALVKAHSVERVHPRAFQVRGMLHGRRGRDEEAIRDFSRYILEYNPASAKSLYERALAYEQTGKLEEARSDLKRSIELAPQSPGGTALARVTARLGKVQEAVALVDQAVAKRDSADKPAWAKANLRAIHRGRTLAMADRATEARAEYEAALREIDERLEQLPRLSGPAIDAETLALLVAKARLFATTDRAPEAIALADRVLELQPENPIMLIERCRARLYTQGQMAQARQDCDIAKRSDLANSEARYVSGLISLKAHDWDRAASDFKVLAKTGNTLALFGLGLAKFRSGETAEGGAYMELARSGSPEVDFEFHRFGITIDSDADVADGNTLPGLTLYKWGTDGHPTREPVTVEDFISRGYYRMEKWQLGDALADLDRAIGLAPDSSLAHSIRAHVLIRLGRLDDAEVAINKATSLAAVHPGSFQVRGLLKARRGRTEEAIRDFSHNLVPSETSAIWLFERGLAYERAGQFEKSLIDLQSAITLMPQPKVRVALARVTARLGDLEEAIAIADETASGLDSANLPAWRKSYLLALRRGKILRMAGREEQARSEYEAALRQVDARLAQLPAQQGPTVRGIALLRARADLLILTDQAQEAIAVADQALAVQPDNVAMLTARCEARLRASLQPTLARQDCDAARSKDPANHQTLYMSGLASLKASDWDRAAGEFQLLVKELPSAPGALFGLGVSKMRRSAGAEGGADIELARTLSSEVDADFDLFGIKP
jgi:tetratricopeptide (TPR) repeat protein